MKPKVALVKSGFLPAGSENKRGRLSVGAIAQLKKLASEGWTIDGYSKSSATNEVTKVAKPDPNRVVDVPDEARSESLWSASVVFEGKPKDIGMRTCCINCDNSLTYCRCSKSVVWADHETPAIVAFKPKSVK